MVEKEGPKGMADEPHNVIPDDLRALRAGQDRIENDLRDLKFRVGDVERGVAGLQGSLAHHSSRLDRIDDRLQTIEKRPGLVDA